MQKLVLLRKCIKTTAPTVTHKLIASIRSTMFPFIATIGSIGQIILLYIGGQQIINGSLTIGELVAFGTYLTLLAWPTAALSWIINIIQQLLFIKTNQ